MTDIHSKERRSYNMSKIKGKNTKPEMLARKYLFSKGFRYKLHDKKLSGKPDIVLPMYKTVIFIHGCFWHGHKNCKYFGIPKTRTEWWTNKIEGNIARDTQNKIKLVKDGWNVLEVWECSLKTSTIDKALSDLEFKIKSNARILL